MSKSVPPSSLSKSEKGKHRDKESGKDTFKSSRKGASDRSSAVSAINTPTKEATKVTRIALIGLSGCGRTALMNRIVTGTFTLPKHSMADETSPTIDINGVKFELLNPVADEERALDELSIWQSRIDGLVVVFDLTDNDSFTQFSFWLEVRSLCQKWCFPSSTCAHALFVQRSKMRSKVATVVVASHSDEKASREVSVEKSRALCERFELSLFEVSAKTGENVRTSIEFLLTAIRAREKV